MDNTISHYSGTIGVSYLSQIYCFVLVVGSLNALLNFVLLLKLDHCGYMRSNYRSKHNCMLFTVEIGSCHGPPDLTQPPPCMETCLVVLEPCCTGYPVPNLCPMVTVNC